VISKITTMEQVIGQGLVLAGAGVYAGRLGALWLTQALAGMLYRVTARIP